MNLITFLLLLLGAAITASGQILMKRGSQILQQVLIWPESFNVIRLIKNFFTIIFQPNVFLAFMLYFLGSFLWLKILTRGDLGYLYPILIGLTILITSLVSYFLFKENFTILKILGIIFLVFGIVLIFSKQ